MVRERRVFRPGEPALREPLTALDQIVTGLQRTGRLEPSSSPARSAGPACLVGPGVVRRCCSRSRSSLPALLPLSAFTAGHPFRVRYMVPLVAARWALAGVAIGRAAEALAIAGRGAPRRARARSRRRRSTAGGPMVVEAQRERPLQRAREAVTRYLAAEHDGSPILASMGSLGHYMQETSHDRPRAFDDFVHEGNGDLWAGALERPRSHVRWILIEELAEGGDVLAARAKRRSGVPRRLRARRRRRRGGALPTRMRSEMNAGRRSSPDCSPELPTFTDCQNRIRNPKLSDPPPRSILSPRNSLAAPPVSPLPH